MLEAEGLDDVDAFMTLTDMDEENLIMSMVASHKNVPKVVTKVNRLGYFMVEKMGIDTVVSPKMTTANEIAQYVRAMQNTVGSKVDTLYKLVDGKAEALEFTAGAHCPPPGRNPGGAAAKAQPAGSGDCEKRQGRSSPSGRDHIQEGTTS